MRGRLIMVFGLTDDGATNEVWTMDLEDIRTQEGQWELEDAGQNAKAPSPRSDSCCAYSVFSSPLTPETGTLSNSRHWRMTCFGGRDASGDQQDLWAFDFRKNDPGVNATIGFPTPPTGRGWTKLDATGVVPARRFGHQCAIASVNRCGDANGLNVATPTFYIVGGLSRATGSPVNDGHVVFAFYYGSYAWRQLSLPGDSSDLLARRAFGFMCTVVATGRFYIIGGSNGDQDVAGELVTLEADKEEGKANFNTTATASISDSSFGNSPDKRHSHCDFRIGEQHFIAFGRDASGNIFNDVWHRDRRCSSLAQGHAAF
jgi:hypothetical protein